jgi:hypothetical protein
MVIIRCLSSVWGELRLIVIECCAYSSTVRFALPPHDNGTMRAWQFSKHLRIIEPYAVLGSTGRAGNLLCCEGRTGDHIFGNEAGLDVIYGGW